LECTTESLKRFGDMPPHTGLDLQLTDTYNSRCIVLLDIKNLTDQAFYLEVNPKAQENKHPNDLTTFFSSSSFITIEPLAVKRVPVAVPRVYFKKNEIPPIEPAVRKYVTKELHLTPEQFNTQHACQFYRDNLCKAIFVRWHCVAQNCSGILVLSKIKLQPETFVLYKFSDVTLEIVLLDQNNAPPKKENTFPVHSMVKVQLKIKNNTENELNAVQSSLLPLAMQTTSVSWIGKIHQVTIPKIQPGESVSHDFLTFFHSVGSFQIVANCVDTVQNLKHWSRQEVVEIV